MVTGRSTGPIGGRAGSGETHRAARPLGNVPPIDTSGPQYLAFMARVLEAAIADRIRKGKKQFSDIGSGELAPIETAR
jgi:hypothetical protein